MIIDDLPFLIRISEHDKIVGGQQKKSYNNKATSTALAYADGSDAYAVTGTSVFLDRGVSESEGFSVSESSQ